MKTKSKKYNWMELLAVGALVMSAGSAFAQTLGVDGEGSGHSGGGNITEADLRYYMGKIDTYLQSVEGRAVFPEIAAYDQAHPTEKFHDLLLNTKPVVQKGELKDSNGVVRDCMSYANPGNRYFVCNSDALPNKTLENQPSFYRIVLHELFVQAEIEKPFNNDVRSVYAISSKITDNVHLETYQEWVPGKPKSDASSEMNQCSYELTFTDPRDWDSADLIERIMKRKGYTRVYSHANYNLIYTFKKADVHSYSSSSELKKVEDGSSIVKIYSIEDIKEPRHSILTDQYYYVGTPNRPRDTVSKLPKCKEL